MQYKAHHTQGLLLFGLNHTGRFAMGTLKIRELVPYGGMSAFPGAHPAVIGTALLRGQTIPIIDMAAAVGFTPLTAQQRKQGFIIITDCQRKVAGLLVHSVDNIIECDWREIQPPPEALGRNAFLTGVTRHDGRLVQLLDVELLLGSLFPVKDEARVASLTDVQREQLRPMNILLVDDSKMARAQLCDALDAINIPYQVATHGGAALEKMHSDANAGKPVDILVSDIEMPGLDGYELAFEVKNAPALAGAYTILHTSLSSAISVSQAKQVGADEALTKFDARELIAAMLRGVRQDCSRNS